MLALSDPVELSIGRHAEVVAESCLLLNVEDFEGWLNLCAPGFNYRITTYSPALSAEMCWLDSDREHMKTLLDGLRTHVRVPGVFFRSPGASFFRQEPDGQTRLVTPISIFHTTPQGATTIFAVCRYHDQMREANGRLQIVDREVRLDTRLLEFAPHVVL